MLSEGEKTDRETRTRTERKTPILRPYSRAFNWPTRLLSAEKYDNQIKHAQKQIDGKSDSNACRPSAKQKSVGKASANFGGTKLKENSLTPYEIRLKTTKTRQIFIFCVDSSSDGGRGMGIAPLPPPDAGFEYLNVQLQYISII